MLMKKILLCVLCFAPLYLNATSTFAYVGNYRPGNNVVKPNVNHNHAVAAVGAKRCHYSQGRKICQGAAVGPRGKAHRGATIRR